MEAYYNDKNGLMVADVVADKTITIQISPIDKIVGNKVVDISYNTFGDNELLIDFEYGKTLEIYITEEGDLIVESD